MMKLSEYIQVYHLLVNTKSDENLRKLLVNVSNKVLRGKPTINEKRFYEYLWSFERSTGKHQHRLTNNILEEAMSVPLSPITPRLPKLKRIKIK